MRRLPTFLTTAAVVALSCASGIAFFGAWTRGQEADRWPSLDDEPPLAVSVQPAGGGWEALLPLLDLPEGAEERITDTADIEGPPLDPGFWVLVADELDALDALLQAHPTITSPVADITAQAPNLRPLLTLARALCLRGWTSYESSDYTAAVDDMLAADSLGVRLAEGGQDIVAVVVGLSIQQLALVELEELLAVTDDPAAHQRAAAGLADHQRDATQIRRAALIECRGFEVMFRDFEDNPALISQTAPPSEPAPEPGVLDRLNAMRYDADATIAQHRRNCRAQDAWLAEPPATRTPEPPDVMPDIPEASAYNRIGLTLLTIAAPSMDLVVDREHRVVLQRSGLRLLTAARRYAYDHGGQLPADDAALVPDYLPAPLPDPFTISPLSIDGGRIQTGDPEHSWAVELPEGR